MKRYEGMFLFDTAVLRDWPSIEQEVRRLLERIGARLLVAVKFDERKLAYEIRRRKRGTYVLTYFEASPDKIADLERDARLSETVLRLLVLRAQNLTEERLAQLRAHPADVPIAPQVGEGRRHDDEHHEGDRGGRRSRDEQRRDREASPAGAEAGAEVEAAEL